MKSTTIPGPRRQRSGKSGMRALAWQWVIRQPGAECGGSETMADDLHGIPKEPVKDV